MVASSAPERFPEAIDAEGFLAQGHAFWRFRNRLEFGARRVTDAKPPAHRSIVHDLSDGPFGVLDEILAIRLTHVVRARV